MHDKRTNLAKDVKEKIHEIFGDMVLDTTIPRNVKLAYALRINLDRHHTHGLWIEKVKKVKKGSKNNYEMRSREVPVNSNLYLLLKAYLDTSPGSFVINRMRNTNMQLPLTPRNINTIFDKHLNIPLVLRVPGYLTGYSNFTFCYKSEIRLRNYMGLHRKSPKIPILVHFLYKR